MKESSPVAVAAFVLTEIVYIVLFEVNEEGVIFVSWEEQEGI